MPTCSLQIVSLVTLLCLGAACSSPPASSFADTPAAGAPAAASRDACSLITPEEAAKILGSPVKATPRSSSAERSTCDYVSESYESFTVEAIWKGAEDAITTARGAATGAAELSGATRDPAVSEVMGLQRVDNLGDEAYFSRRTMSYVRKGDVLLVFQNAGLNEPAREHWAALARAALARL